MAVLTSNGDRAEQAGVDLPAVPLAAAGGAHAVEQVLPLAVGVEGVGGVLADIGETVRVLPYIRAVVRVPADELHADRELDAVVVDQRGEGDGDEGGEDASEASSETESEDESEGDGGDEGTPTPDEVQEALDLVLSNEDI